MKQAPLPETATQAYRRDTRGTSAPFCDDDGAIIVVATLLEQAFAAPVAELPKFIDEANRLAAEALARSFPDAWIAELAPGELDLRPLRALVRAIEHGLPSLANVLGGAIIEVETREVIEGGHATEAARVAMLARYDDGLEQVMPGYKDAPMPMLCGLSQNQWTDLNFGGDWLTTGPLRLDKTLSLADLDRADLLHDARFILAHLRDNGPLAATEDGYVEREPAAMLGAQLRTHNVALDSEMFRDRSERLDLWPWVTRELLETSGLITLTKGAFQITMRGRGMVADSKAGMLFMALFGTLFRDSLWWLDGSGTEQRGLDASVAGFLYLISIHGKSWKLRERYVEVCWPEPLRDPEPTGKVFDTELRPLEYPLKPSIEPSCPPSILHGLRALLGG